jgi:hypothetical protein
LRQASLRRFRRLSRAAFGRLSKARLRLPTAVWVSLLGALLSVWILPAVTRQWNDRQKARELKTVLAQDVEAASAQALSVGWSLNAPWKLDEAEAAERAWFTAQLKIEAKIRAQFPDDRALLRLWRRFEPTVAAYGAVISEVSSPLDESLSPAGAINVRREWIRTQVRKILPRKEVDYYVGQFVPDGVLAGDVRFVQYARWAAASRLRDDVLEREQPFIQSLLSAHPAGFSTTRGDLLRDLFP